MKIESIKVLKDNYVWAIVENDEVVIVDPGEAEPVKQFIQQNNLQLIKILITHKHADHVGGAAELIREFGEVAIVGPVEVSDLVTEVVTEDYCFDIFGTRVRVLKSAGHTEEHISYLVDNKYLFCGDALFMAGCGRVFTGNYEEQFNTLQKFKKLADHVLIYAGHEYSMTNLRFAEEVLPEEEKITTIKKQVAEKLALGLPSLPSIISLEKVINPFLLAATSEEFKILRDRRDKF